MAHAASFSTPMSPIPGDVRLMHVTANALFVVAGLVLGAIALNRVVRLPVFSLRAIHVDSVEAAVERSVKKDS